MRLAPELAGEWPARPFSAYVQFVRERFGLLLPSPGGSMVPGETTARLAHLVVCGDKRITTSWPPQIAHDGATTPVPGLISIVTDGLGL
jgi:hypothetical protein